MHARSLPPEQLSAAWNPLTVAVALAGGGTGNRGEDRGYLPPPACRALLILMNVPPAFRGVVRPSFHPYRLLCLGACRRRLSSSRALLVRSDFLYVSRSPSLSNSSRALRRRSSKGGEGERANESALARVRPSLRPSVSYTFRVSLSPAVHGRRAADERRALVRPLAS